MNYFKLILEISRLFHCCGANGPDDIKNSTVALECCHVDNDTNAVYNQGCADVTVDLLKKNALNFLLIPSCVILLVELYAILIIPVLIGICRRHKLLENKVYAFEDDLFINSNCYSYNCFRYQNKK